MDDIKGNFRQLHEMDEEMKEIRCSILVGIEVGACLRSKKPRSSTMPHCAP